MKQLRMGILGYGRSGGDMHADAIEEVDGCEVAAVCDTDPERRRQATDRFASLLAAALATVFALQTLIIMGGLLRLIPLTGLTTPFLSYGGTSIVINFLAVGLLLAISRDCVPQPEESALT